MAGRRPLRDIQAELEWLGCEPAPAPRVGFADELESRLRAVAVGVVAVSPAAATERRPLRRFALATVAVAAVVAFVAGLGVARTTGDRDVRMAEGARATTGDPLEVAPQAGESGEGPANAGTVTTQATAASLQSATGEPRVGEHASGAEGSTAAAVGADELAVDPEDTSSAPVAEIALRASGTPARVFLDWDRYERDDFAAYLVLRSSAPHDPDHPDENTLLMRRIETRDTTTYDDTPKLGDTNRWRVVVIDASGTVVGRSNVVTPDALGQSRTPVIP